jgi:hypothetical protein
VVGQVGLKPPNVEFPLESLHFRGEKRKKEREERRRGRRKGERGSTQKSL